MQFTLHYRPDIHRILHFQYLIYIIGELPQCNFVTGRSAASTNTSLQQALLIYLSEYRLVCTVDNVS